MRCELQGKLAPKKRVYGTRHHYHPPRRLCIILFSDGLNKIITTLWTAMEAQIYAF